MCVTRDVCYTSVHHSLLVNMMYAHNDNGVHALDRVAGIFCPGVKR